jgi:hypothetical protein
MLARIIFDTKLSGFVHSIGKRQDLLFCGVGLSLMVKLLKQGGSGLAQRRPAKQAGGIADGAQLGGCGQ